jgi:hypothetical protein
LKIVPPLRDPYLVPPHKYQRNVSILLNNSEREAAQPLTGPVSLGRLSKSSLQPCLSSPNLRSTMDWDFTSVSYNNTSRTSTQNAIMDSIGLNLMMNLELETNTVVLLEEDFAQGRRPRSTTKNCHGSSMRTSLERDCLMTCTKHLRTYALMPRTLSTQNCQSSPHLIHHNFPIPNG